MARFKFKESVVITHTVVSCDVIGISEGFALRGGGEVEDVLEEEVESPTIENVLELILAGAGNDAEVLEDENRTL